MDNDKQPKSSAQLAREVSDIKGLIDGEVYFGFNLAIMLADATQAERDTIRAFFQRAKDKREGLGRAKREVTGPDGKVIGRQG